MRQEAVTERVVIERIAYPVAQAAEAVGRSRYVLYAAIRRKELPAYQASEDSDILVMVDDLKAWIRRFPAQPRRGKTA